MLTIFAPILNSYWWIIPLFFLLAFLKSPFMKGVVGEFQVNFAANHFLDKSNYTLFKNITLPTEDGTTQIDHIIVCRYGVFVIETKNMQGWIFGSSHQKMWTQKIYRHTSKFQNPLHQNYKHTQTLQSALELQSNKVFSLVVFVGDCTFKTAMPENVVYKKEFIGFIKTKTQTLLRDDEVIDICERLSLGRLKPSIKTHIDHVKHVKTITETKQKTTVNSCPKCGKPMILKQAKSGNNQGKQFWGCSAFPKCRMIKPLA